MNTPERFSTKVLGITENDMLPRIEGFRVLKIDFQEDFRGRVETQLLKNLDPAIQNKILVRHRNGVTKTNIQTDVIIIEEEGRHPEELPPERGNLEAVLKEYTEKNVLNPRPLIKIGFLWVKDEVDYILNQEGVDNKGVDNIKLSFKNWMRMNGRRVPPYLQITAPKEVVLDAIIKNFRLDRKKQIRGDIQELFKHYYPNEPTDRFR